MSRRIRATHTQLGKNQICSYNSCGSHSCRVHGLGFHVFLDLWPKLNGIWILAIAHKRCSGAFILHSLQKAFARLIRMSVYGCDTGLSGARLTAWKVMKLLVLIWLCVCVYLYYLFSPAQIFHIVHFSIWALPSKSELIWKTNKSRHPRLWNKFRTNGNRAWMWNKMGACIRRGASTWNDQRINHSHISNTILQPRSPLQCYCFPIRSTPHTADHKPNNCKQSQKSERQQIESRGRWKYNHYDE